MIMPQQQKLQQKLYETYIYHTTGEPCFQLTTNHPAILAKFRPWAMQVQELGMRSWVKLHVPVKYLPLPKRIYKARPPGPARLEQLQKQAEHMREQKLTGGKLG